jgi:superfamily II DNA or RNA helicase
MPFAELNTSLLAELGGWPALKEARLLVERGKVRDARREGDVIRARVQGAEKAYEPKIILAERVAKIEVGCTCVEFRRSGRVCAHILAAGLAVLQPATGVPFSAASVSRSTRTATGPKRWLADEAPPEIPRIEVTVLLPLNLTEAFSRDPVRLILEVRREGWDVPAPWDAAMRDLDQGFAVEEDDARLLDALEAATGALVGVTAIPRARLGEILHALSGHPRVWEGKKQRIEIRAAAGRGRILVGRREDGSLELKVEASSPLENSTKEMFPGWRLEGRMLVEASGAPLGFSQGHRIVPAAAIPDFLAREWPGLERDWELVFPPGFEEFVLETGRPVIEAHLEGALSGLTLELSANYGDRSFPVAKREKAAPDETYFPDSTRAGRFWCRDLQKEKEAVAEVEAAGFKPARSGVFSLIQENQVARFLANTLPRWRREWKIALGSRLESTMEQVDLAEPEFSLRGGSGEDWLSLDLRLAVRGEPVPLDAAEVQRWLQTGQSHARTANHRVLLVPTEAWSEMREVLADCEIEQEPGSMRVARTYAPFLSEALTTQGFQARGKIEGDRPVIHVQGALEPELWKQLRPYQVKGIEWLAGLAQQNFSGLLADDMGLGKTLQALAFCAWLQSTREKAGPALVVCPTSLVANWLREAARFVPQLRALDLTGAERAVRFRRAGEFDLLVTSYAILRRDVERYRALAFSLVILDEAQHIKNRGSQNAQAAKSLRARHRLILTGTPLENSVLDLWSLFDFLLPGYLGTATEFRERYETPLTRGPEPRTMQRLRHRVRPFFLRRTKEEVLPELPPKLEHLTLCELSDEQREVYRAVLAQGRRDVFAQTGKSGAGRDGIAVLTTLLRLRQVCCHLELLPQGEEKRAWKEPSAKLDRTFELIDEAIDGGHRVLLFSQFVRALHLLRDEARRREIAFSYLDGQTVERQAEVDRFQRDAGVPLFLISLKAGGTGLNLTGADTVIHFDPWWNPAVEQQATARAHRLGQARRVQAYKLIAAGTVEEKIQALQARKKEWFEASVGGDEAFVQSLTGDEMEELLAG